MLFDVIRRQIDRSVPFAGVLGVQVDALDGQMAEAHLPADGRLANHVGTVHAGALFSLCESASGAALAGAMAGDIARTRMVVRGAEVEYLKPATGKVVARACLADDVSSVQALLRQHGRADVGVDVKAVVKGDDGVEAVVARAAFTWHVRWQAS